MKLKSGFKKFLIIAFVTAIAGVGICLYKPTPKPPAPAVEEQAAQQAPQATEQPVAQEATAPVQQEAPVVTAPQQDASTNRGLQNVLNAGKK